MSGFPGWLTPGVVRRYTSRDEKDHNTCQCEQCTFGGLLGLSPEMWIVPSYEYPVQDLNPVMAISMLCVSKPVQRYRRRKGKCSKAAGEARAHRNCLEYSSEHAEVYRFQGRM